MIVDRRTTLAGLIGGAVAGAAPARAALTGRPAVLVIDSRRAASKAFVASMAGARVIDIACAADPSWATLRALTPSAGRVRGLTGWSDWVLLRAALQDRGLRARATTPVDPHRAGDSGLFLWEMA